MLVSRRDLFSLFQLFDTYTTLILNVLRIATYCILHLFHHDLENADFTDAYIGDFDIRNLCKNPTLTVRNILFVNTELSVYIDTLLT